MYMYVYVYACNFLTYICMSNKYQNMYIRKNFISFTMLATLGLTSHVWTYISMCICMHVCTYVYMRACNRPINV